MFMTLVMTAGCTHAPGLASDEGRFSNSPTTIRAIVYYGLAENSDLGSVFQPAPKDSPDYSQKLGSYLRRGVFYDFGMGADVHGDPAFLETARAFWKAALRSMAATVIGLGADLNVPNSLPLHGYSWPVTLQFDDQALDGRLSLLVGEDGNLADSWLGTRAWVRRRSAARSGVPAGRTPVAGWRLKPPPASPRTRPVSC